MILLTALTMLGLAAASDAGLQNRITGNIAQARLAARTAEATLAWAEHWLLGLPGELRPATCTDFCAGGQVIRAPGMFPAAPEHESGDWWALNGSLAGRDPVSGEVLDARLEARDGLWIIEEAYFAAAGAPEGVSADTGFYRIIARGSASGAGQSGISFSVTESVIARPWGDPAWADSFPRLPGQSEFCASLGPGEPCGRLAWQQRR